MGWLKRNMFFAIGGAAALLLLGAAGFYDFQSWSHNQKAFADLNDVYGRLTSLNQQQPSPGDTQHNNIQAAQDQARQLRQWMGETTNYFQPIAPIPKPGRTPLSNSAFSDALHQTLAQLQSDAAAANVALPPQFYFSFTVDQDRLTYARGSLRPLSVQLGEVKAISEIIFKEGVNGLDGIQRVAVSPDDAGGPQTDYLTEQPVTNSMAVLVPYLVTFRGFSQDIARVLEAFAQSPHGFIVKNISVQPAGGSATFAAPAGYQSPEDSFGSQRSFNSPPRAVQPGQGGLQTVLNEQLLRVTMEIEIVKLKPGI